VDTDHTTSSGTDEDDPKPKSASLNNKKSKASNTSIIPTLNGQNTNVNTKDLHTLPSDTKQKRS
jgi:hypothetical protein